MTDVFRAKPFPRGLTGTASTGNYDIDLTFFIEGQGSGRTKCVPTVMTIIVETDATAQFLGPEDATVPGAAGTDGNVSLGNTIPLKAGVVYIMRVSAEALRFINSAVEYRIIVEY